MCQTHVELEKGGVRERIMDHVTTLEVHPDGVTITTLFEEPRVLPGARLKRIDFLDGRVLLSVDDLAPGGP